MDDYAPIFKSLDKAFAVYYGIIAVVVLILVLIAIRIIKAAKSGENDKKPASPALKTATIVCYVIIAILITSPLWIFFTPIMDRLKEIV